MTAPAVKLSRKTKGRNKMPTKKDFPTNTPPIVSPQDWKTPRQQLFMKEKALTRSRDASAAERRRVPWMAVGKAYEFEGPRGKASLLDLFEGRPEHACRGCSLGADQVAHLGHLNARYHARPSGDLGRLAGGLSPEPAVQVVELARQLRRRGVC